MPNKRILIVDDDPVARTILNALLKPHYHLAMSGDAMAAFTEARKSPPDLILLDLGLPAGGGFSVLQRVKAIPALSTIPVVVISGLDKASNEQKALDAGADAYIQKPADHGELLARIRQLLGE